MSDDRLFIDNEGHLPLQPFEDVWRQRRSYEVFFERVPTLSVGRLVAHSDRPMTYRAASDCLRATKDLLAMLDESDVTVLSYGEPVAVVIPVEEYRRLTGRKPQPQERA